MKRIQTERFYQRYVANRAVSCPHMTVIVLTMIICLCMPLSVFAADAYDFVWMIEENGEGDGQFIRPRGVAVDTDGYVYVVDEINGNVQKFDSNGNFLAKLITGMSRPAGLTVDKFGNIYVADNYFNQITKYDNGGSKLLQFGEPGTDPGQFMSCKDVALDKDGNIYVTDGLDLSQYGVSKFDTAGTFIMWFGERGSGEGQLESPCGIGIDPDGNVYVADKGNINRKVVKYDDIGQYITEWNTADDKIMSAPSGLAVDGLSNVYVVDGSRSVAYKFDKQGTYLCKIGGQGSGEGKFRVPWGIDIDFAGNVYVSDSADHKLQKFAPGTGSDDTTTTTTADECSSEEIYGEYSEETERLREFRDNVLTQTPEGKELIKLYYEWSPAIVKAMEEDEAFKEEVKEMIDGVLLLIGEE